MKPTSARWAGWIVCAALAAWSGACAGTPVEPEPKTAEDLYREADELAEGTRVLFFLETVDYARVIEQFQAIIDEYPFSEFATLSELRIGDAYFDQGNFAQAASFYQEFVELHPTHPKVPYALLRNGECAFQEMLAPDQDQGKTRTALEQFEILTRRFPDTPEAAQARELRDQVIDRLAVAEALVGDFYYSTEKYHAAVPRYRDALETAAQHTGYRRTRARLGMALKRLGKTEEGEGILREVLPDPELDPEIREEAEELGIRVAVRQPEDEGGFRLWPFGGGGGSDDAAGTPPSADEPKLGSAAAASSPPPDVSEPEEEADSGSWFWPFD